MLEMCFFIFCESWKDLIIFRGIVIDRSSSVFDGEGIAMHLTLCSMYIFIKKTTSLSMNKIQNVSNPVILRSNAHS